MNWIELSAFCHFQGQRFALSWAKKNLSKEEYEAINNSYKLLFK